MSRFVRMPWDETMQRWSARELEHALRLHADRLNHTEIADALAVAGFPPRDETAVYQKLRELVEA